MHPIHSSNIHRCLVTHLRGGADETWPYSTPSLFHPAENSGDSVGLGEQSGIAHGERRAQAQPSQRTDDRGGFGQEEEGHGVGHKDPEEEDVTQLPAGGFYQRRVVVSDEHPEHQAGAHEPGDRGEVIGQTHSSRESQFQEVLIYSQALL